MHLGPNDTTSEIGERYLDTFGGIMRDSIEYILLVKRSVWQCARPCSRAYRHRDEQQRTATCHLSHVRPQQETD